MYYMPSFVPGNMSAIYGLLFIICLNKQYHTRVAVRSFPFLFAKDVDLLAGLLGQNREKSIKKLKLMQSPHLRIGKL